MHHVHMVFFQDLLSIVLKAAELAGFVCTNTIDQTENQKLYPEMTVLSMAPLLAGLIHAVEENSSLSEVLAHAFDD